MTYNARRELLGVIPIGQKITYHLFNIGSYSGQKSTPRFNLSKKATWNPYCEGNQMSGLDFNPTGELVATMDIHGTCLVADINIDSYRSHLDAGRQSGKNRSYRQRMLFLFLSGPRSSSLSNLIYMHLSLRDISYSSL